MQSDRGFFPAAQMPVTLTAGISTARGASLLPFTVTASSARRRPHSTQSPRHPAERRSLLGTLRNQSLARLGFKGTIISLFYMASLFEMLVTQRSETYCHIRFVSLYFFNYWHLYLMSACRVFFGGSGNKGLRKGTKENTLLGSDCLITMWIYSLSFVLWALHFLGEWKIFEKTLMRHMKALPVHYSYKRLRYRSVILWVGMEESKKQN